jgi:hypothetical protein
MGWFLIYECAELIAEKSMFQMRLLLIYECAELMAEKSMFKMRLFLIYECAELIFDSSNEFHVNGDNSPPLEGDCCCTSRSPSAEKKLALTSVSFPPTRLTD